MATKKMNIEELKQQCLEAEKNFKFLREQLEEAEKKEEEEKKAKLANERESRKKEVDEAIANCKSLLRAYMNDYGAYSWTYNEDNGLVSSKLWDLIW